MADPVDVIAEALDRLDSAPGPRGRRQDASAIVGILTAAGWVLVSPEQVTATRRGLGDIASLMRSEPINVDAYNRAAELANSWEATPDA